MKLICIALFLALIIASCDKAIPDETMDGRGTFYCKVNGEDYFPDCRGFACQDVTAGYFSLGDDIVISSQGNFNEVPLDINIYIYYISTSPSIAILWDEVVFLDNTSISRGCGDTYLQSENDFKLLVTKVDLNARVISGTFSGVFTRVEDNHSCTDTIHLTDGIFDLPITF